MKTLEDIQRQRDALDRKLEDACAAAAARGETIHVTEADLARFEEACRPSPVSHAVAPQKGEWVRC
jgi:hypothetical protein